MFATLSPFIRRTLLSQRPTTRSAFPSPIRQITSTSAALQPPISSLQRPRRSEPTGNTWNNVLGDYIATSSKQVPLTPEAIWQQKSDKAKKAVEEDPPAGAYSGRSVKVLGGNVADAYARLNSILQRNKVRAQLRRAERHEKKGEKRRRLESERWRRQFAHEVRSFALGVCVYRAFRKQVRKKVQLVTKIRNRGA
ncbi:hypothetical protein DXG03_000869 [Asterophora parasitica]|uniref:Uncharacterized protein n=1 Tax=Asterophora parasitica TaxID=117018 RepID=A0A9P7K9J4_9AGAR|nr:hypothetical protein DXG03_000869 [Asterophora parasitica]